MKFAVIASLSQAIGAVISRYAMTEPESLSPPCKHAIIRLLAGIIYLTILLILSKRRLFSGCGNGPGKQDLHLETAAYDRPGGIYQARIPQYGCSSYPSNMHPLPLLKHYYPPAHCSYCQSLPCVEKNLASARCAAYLLPWAVLSCFSARHEDPTLT